jgi:hypothetical protein
MDRLPESNQLDINRTFQSQRTAINNYIIPVIQKSLNKEIFPVVDGIIDHIIHERHRHQRGEFLNRERGDEWYDTDKRRRHANSRRNEVSNK